MKRPAAWIAAGTLVPFALFAFTPLILYWFFLSGHNWPLEHRIGAKLVPEFAENLTPAAELEKLRAPVETFFITRDRGAGRPTKKDRRAAMRDAVAPLVRAEKTHAESAEPEPRAESAEGAE